MKNNNYKVGLVFSSVLIFAAGWILFESTFAKNSSKTEISNFAPDIIITSKALSIPLVKQVAGQVAKPEAKPVVFIDTTLENRLQPLIKDLQQLKAIKAKVFRTAAEENTIKEFIHNPDKLQSLVMLLTDTKSLSVTTAENHQSAVDILLEAAKSADSKIAEELILVVIQDKQVEDTSTNKVMRESLASIKAELMYNATSIDKQTVQNSIPGPVSQKIWDTKKTILLVFRLREG